MAENINNFFASVGAKLAANILHKTTGVKNKLIHQSLFLHPFSPEEIFDLLTKLKPTNHEDQTINHQEY